MAMAMNFARSSVRLFPRALVLQRRPIHSTPVAFKKKRSKAVVEDLFDDEEQWGVVEDLIPTTPREKPSSSTSDAVVASTSSPIAQLTKKIEGRRLGPGQRLDRFYTLVRFVKPRIGRHPTKKTPLIRRTVFPQLIQLATTPEHIHIITDLMVTWKEGRLGTQGKARFGPDGKPKGAYPFAEPTSELFARRCEELGIPEHALEVYGAFPKYAFPLTLPAARRLLHGLLVAERPLADIVTATALYAPHGLPPVNEDLASSALLLSACLKHLKTTEGKTRKETQALVNELVSSLEAQLATTAPMAESRDVRDKTVRKWLKSVMLDVNEFLRGNDQPRGWLESWMMQSRFKPSVN
ncbi:hypothetical protein B0H19DRAFT_1166940 [Mycena capillaripes]|nr:hypothetical protein B0H19DRAFT_1166940 [Mycena capillaripes]